MGLKILNFMNRCNLRFEMKSSSGDQGWVEFSVSADNGHYKPVSAFKGMACMRMNRRFPYGRKWSVVKVEKLPSSLREPSYAP